VVPHYNIVILLKKSTKLQAMQPTSMIKNQNSDTKWTYRMSKAAPSNSQYCWSARVRLEAKELLVTLQQQRPELTHPLVMGYRRFWRVGLTERLLLACRTFYRSVTVAEPHAVPSNSLLASMVCPTNMVSKRIQKGVPTS